ncbi:ABC transporter permease [Yersinia aleksiciae]|uniref:ABC transporter permease n=1 Tax=Yersinia aleksiciae TaxID=263819 RepID=UPI0025AE0288|nr:ABC transporter permease [Yersinia aleksiciae]
MLYLVTIFLFFVFLRRINAEYKEVDYTTLQFKIPDFHRWIKLMQGSSIQVALKDIIAAIRRFSLVGMLGWQDVRQRYRRSTLGPFWLTISMGVIIGTIGIVFGSIFRAPLAEFLPFLACGMILWTFFTTVINEGCAGFISAERVIKQLPIPLFVHILRILWRNILILGHNIVILPLVFLVVGKPLTIYAFLAIPGFMLTVLNLTWVALVLGILCARYRDLPQIIASLLNVIFYFTPIMWMPHLVPERVGEYILGFNPVFHLINIVRAPLLGQLPEMASWGMALALTVLGWSFALIVYGRYKRRIAYWL